jgi:hypothetical protein
MRLHVVEDRGGLWIDGICFTATQFSPIIRIRKSRMLALRGWFSVVPARERDGYIGSDEEPLLLHLTLFGRVGP